VSTVTPRGWLNPPGGGPLGADGTWNRKSPSGVNTCARNPGMSPTHTFPLPATVTSRPPPGKSPGPDPNPPNRSMNVPARSNRFTKPVAESTTYTHPFSSSMASPRRSGLFPNWPPALCRAPNVNL
jgi:hypothetical protein